MQVRVTISWALGAEFAKYNQVDLYDRVAWDVITRFYSFSLRDCDE